MARDPSVRKPSSRFQGLSHQFLLAQQVSTPCKVCCWNLAGLEASSWGTAWPLGVRKACMSIPS